MQESQYKWDIFIAHASADIKSAEVLYDLLAKNCKVFLDTKCIELGSDWDLELSRTQNTTRISVILVSSNTETAYYQREEIAAAIDLARDDEKSHRVVPVFLDKESKKSTDVPYGLRLKHGLLISEKTSLHDVADRLLKLIDKLNSPGIKEPSLPPKVDSNFPNKNGNKWKKYSALFAAICVVVISLVVLHLRPEKANGDGPEHLECLEINFLSPNKMPHYLLKSIGTENFPYWLKIKGRNNCDKDKIMSLRFETGGNINMPPKGEPFTLKKQQPFNRIFRPEFTLAKPNTENLKIMWSIEDEVQRKVAADTINAEIVPPYTIAWDLEKPKEDGDREPVAKEYLLASLAAWTLRPPPVVVKHGDKCRTSPEGGPILTKTTAIKSCYKHLFSGGTKVDIIKNSIKFPDGKEQKIRPHRQILKDKWATPLEAALLFAAVLGAGQIPGDPDYLMMVVPVDPGESSKLKTVFLMWEKTPGQWQAIDLMHANKPFEGNVLDASDKASTILKGNSEIKTIANEGVAGFNKDESIAVVNFRRAREKPYKIRGMELVPEK